MSVSNTFQPYRAPGIPATAVRIARMITSPIRAWAGKVGRAYERDRAYRQLSAMSDHQLNDIGVSRAEIRAKVYGDRR